MRLILIASCLCLAACGGASDAPASTAAPGVVPASAAALAPAARAAPVPGNASETLDAYLLAMNQHDGDAVGRLLADDVVVFDSLIGNLSNGRAEARANMVDMYLRAVPDGQWTLRGEPVVATNGFSYEWTLTGTNLGNWTSYLRGRGQKISFKGITIVRLAGGRITYQANYFDTQALGAQAGW